MPKPLSAFILAAGQGQRLRPYTETVPKPMVPVRGRPILAHTLEHLAASGIPQIVINTCYKADVIHDFVETYRGPLRISLSKESELLDTGLGIKRALEKVESSPFFVINGDAFWENGPGGDVFDRLFAAWNPDQMDILLLLQPISRMTLTKGSGDYILNERGQAIRQKDRGGNLMFAGIRMCTADIFKDTPETPFSFLTLMDAAESKGRLYGLAHDGAWHHISSPEDLEKVNGVQK
ncbi:MAG: nucleotidyltransferase family protein [Rhodospirillales bacterium]|nr:nucleotidyltransferase family protein [Rhodospirillales bacterium]